MVEVIALWLETVSKAGTNCLPVSDLATCAKRATNQLRHRFRSYTTKLLNSDVVSRPNKALVPY